MGKGGYLGGSSIVRPTQRSPVDEAADTAFAMSQKCSLTPNQMRARQKSQFILTLLREWPDFRKLKPHQRGEIYQSKRWKKLVSSIFPE
jgi:hypothetical protein